MAKYLSFPSSNVTFADGIKISIVEQYSIMGAPATLAIEQHRDDDAQSSGWTSIMLVFVCVSRTRVNIILEKILFAIINHH